MLGCWISGGNSILSAKRSLLLAMSHSSIRVSSSVLERHPGCRVAMDE
jgi:hypothetical protein